MFIINDTSSKIDVAYKHITTVIDTSSDSDTQYIMTITVKKLTTINGILQDDQPLKTITVPLSAMDAAEPPIFESVVGVIAGLITTAVQNNTL